MMRQVEAVRVSMLQSRALSQGDGVPACHKFLETFTCAHTRYELDTVTKFCTVIKLYWKKILQGRPRHLPWPKFF